MPSSQSARFIRQTLYPHRYWLLLQTANVFLWGLLSYSSRQVISTIVDNIESATTGYHELAQTLACLPLITLSWVLSFRLHDYVWRSVKPAMKQDTVQHMMGHLLRHSQRFYQRNSVGKLSNRIWEVASRLPESVETCVDTTLNVLINITITLVTISTYSYRLGALLGGWILLFVITGWKAYPYIKRLNQHVVERNNSVMGHTVDVMNNLSSVRHFTGYNREHTMLSHKTAHTLQAERKRDLAVLFFYFLQGTTFCLMQGSAIWVLFGLLKQGAISKGNLIFTINMIILVATTLFPYLEQVSRLLDNLSYIRRSLHVVYQSHDIPERSNAQTLTVSKGDIHYRDISFRHPNRKHPLLRQFSLSLQGGEHTVLLGTSGSGKSTLIHLLLRLFDPDQGQICIDGQDISCITQDSLHRNISVVTQETYLFQRSIMENIRYGSPEASEEDVVRAAQNAYAHEFIAALPKGYATPISERGSSLSGGQKQRIAIARAFLKQAPILILDEATSQLDPATDFQVQRSIDHLRKSHQQTSIIITHRLSTLSQANRILVLDKGQVIEDGTHETLLKAQGHYSAFITTETTPKALQATPTP